MQLQVRLGADNLDPNCRRRVLHVRGDEDTLDVTADAVSGLCVRLLYAPDAKRWFVYVCPVCLSEVSPPVALACARAARRFPLACFGAGATCAVHIPLVLPKVLLVVDEFDALVGAATLRLTTA